MRSVVFGGVGVYALFLGLGLLAIGTWAGPPTLRLREISFIKSLSLCARAYFILLVR
jgi:hypothetical protein